MCILCVCVKINKGSFEPFCVWNNQKQISGLVLHLLSELDKGDYPENVHVVFCLINSILVNLLHVLCVCVHVVCTEFGQYVLVKIVQAFRVRCSKYSLLLLLLLLLSGP